ncbi:SRPBCC family protein [Leptolyngbya sp. FACHB-261]|uniref:SRPBCC family protein n=1 Tax=Leptolyngbya sp. FACHB-261 TaxID=2692806 RepID=UPI001689FAED|nr:SRPBCC family protein [Leptolyngbya sp. FACHB-261]MBD2102114.1 SRPBCC family protein [Leptolyngbya sp. FACHB-261]
MESVTKKESIQQNDAERWASIIGGGAMVLSGLRQGSLRGALMALAGGTAIYHGVAQQNSIQDALNQTLKVEKTVTINRPVEELYRFWHNFENLPTFMKHLQSVKVIDAKRSHWVAKAPLDNQVEWDADIIKEEENHLIAWASVEGADIDNSGFVRFQPAPAGRGTEVKVVIEYNMPGGTVGAAIAKLFGEEPEQQVGDDLRRFKQLMEAGEIATTEGQPSGRE